MLNDARLCQGCGTEISPRANERNPRKWCSEKCRVSTWRKDNPEKQKLVAARSMVKERTKREAQKPPKPSCENCGKGLSRRHGARFCRASECRSAAFQDCKNRAPRCEEPGCDRPTQARGLCGSHYAARWAKAHPERRAMAHARRRAMKKSAFVENVNPELVMERDRWMCGICGERIPKRAKYPDPLSRSLDHIVPLSSGGEHSMKNVQAAHFLCNSRKKDRGGGEQLALIG